MKRNNNNGGGKGTKSLLFVIVITIMIVFFIYRTSSDLFGGGDEAVTAHTLGKRMGGRATLPPRVDKNYLFVKPNEVGDLVVAVSDNDKAVANNGEVRTANELQLQISRHKAKMAQQAHLIEQQRQELDSMRTMKRKQTVKQAEGFQSPEDALEALRKPEHQQVVREVKEAIDRKQQHESPLKMGRRGAVPMSQKRHKEPKTHPLYRVDDRAAFFTDIEARPSDAMYFRCIGANTSALHRWGCLIHEKQRGHEALIMSDFAAHAYDREVSLLIEDLVRDEYRHQLQAAKRHHDLSEQKDPDVAAKRRAAVDFMVGDPIASKDNRASGILASVLQQYFNIEDKTLGNIQRGARAATVLETLMGQAKRYGGEYWQGIYAGFSPSGRSLVDDVTLSSSTPGVGFSFISAWVPGSERNCEPRRQPAGIFIDNTTSILELESALFHLTSKAFNAARFDLDTLQTEGPEGWKRAKLKFLPLLAASNSWALHCAWAATRLLTLSRDVVESYGKTGLLQQSNQVLKSTGKKLRQDLDGDDSSGQEAVALAAWRSHRFVLEKEKLPAVTASGVVSPVNQEVPAGINHPRDQERYKKRSSPRKLLCVLLVPVAPENEFKEYQQVVDRYQATPKGALMEGGCVHIEIIFGLSAPIKDNPSVRQPVHDQQFMAAQCTDHIDQLLKAKYPDGRRTVNADLLSTIPGYEEPGFAANVGNFVRYRCNHFDHVLLKTGTSQGQSGTAVAGSALAVSSAWEGAIRVMSDDASTKPHEQFSRWFPDPHRLGKKGEFLEPNSRERMMNGLEYLNVLPFDYIAIVPHNADFQAASFTSNYAVSPRVIAAGTTIGAARFFSSLGFAQRIFHPESWTTLRDSLHKEQSQHTQIPLAELEALVENTNRLMIFNRHAQLLLSRILKSSLCRERILGVVDTDGKQLKQVLSPRVLVDYFPLCLRRYSMKLTVPRLEDLSMDPISSYRFTATDSPTENYALIQDKKATNEKEGSVGRDQEALGLLNAGGNILAEAVFSVSMG